MRLGVTKTQKGYQFAFASAKEEPCTLLLYKKGEEAFNTGKYEDAKTNLEKVVALNADHDYAVYYLARSYENLNDVENAKKYFQRVVELLPAETQRAKTAKAYLDSHQ